MKQIFIDLETSGLDPIKDVITEIACIYKKDGKIVKTFSVTTRVGMQEKFLTFLNSIIDKYDAKDKAYLIAYNAKFDSDFLHNYFREIKGSNFGNYFYHTPIDILQITAYKFMMKDKHPDSFKLKDVAKFLKVKINEDKLHTALYDIELTNEVYKKLRKL